MDSQKDLRFFLASRSPRRRLLLEEWGIPFEEVEPGGEREVGREKSPFEAALARAREKCLGARVPRDAGPSLVLSADTLVLDAEGKILGKPRDRKEARSFL